MTPRRITTHFLTIAAIFSIGFVVGMRGELQADWILTDEVEPTSVDLDPVWKAWRLLDEKFVPASTTVLVSDQEKVWGLISGLADSYDDPYTVFMPPQLTKSFEQEIQGEFGGIGVEMGVRDHILTVIAPLKGTPADTAGVRAGDLIIRVDGAPTQQMTIDDAVELIRGEIGTVVILTIAREGESEFLEIPITRDIIQVPTLDTHVEGEDVFVISLYNFGGTAVREMRTALREFITGGYDLLVIDMRGNPGGYLSAAVDTASWFLPLGTTVVIEEYGDTIEPLIHRSKGNTVSRESWRVAILVDGGSASASEILAGSLREQMGAVLIGTQTFGKGSVQELVEVTEDTNLKITIARWLTPNGVSISNGGLTPDLVIPWPADELGDGEDPQLEAALQYLRTGILPPPPQTGQEEVEMPALEVERKVE